VSATGPSHLFGRFLPPLQRVPAYEMGWDVSDGSVLDRLEANMTRLETA
jgi:hypothetical protein